MNGDCYLVEIFLPLADNAGRKFPAAKFTRFAEELKLEFNGVTVYDRKPARGQTKDSSDDIIIFEVIAANLDRAWWASRRSRLEESAAPGKVRDGDEASGTSGEGRVNTPYLRL